MNSNLATIGGMSTDEILWQKRRIAELMEKVLKKNEHYGVIPGTQKPTLYKSGAEIIALTFGLHPEYTVKMNDLAGGHREYEVECRIFRNTDGMALAAGVGTCSTMERKYRWRSVKKFDQATKKEVSEEVENPNLQDLFNTILKMAKKRAYVDAVITSTAASDFVTQDLEDFVEVENPAQPEPYEAEIEKITDMEELKKYWMGNKGKGKKFDQKIAKKKAVLENNKPENENPSN